jgi:MFS family permease
VAAPLPRPVKRLGLVSLLTDASSEMIYPLLPSFLTGVLKASPAFLGLVEGSAEAVASALKLFAGRLSDRTPRRKPFVVLGYGISTLARPLVTLAASPLPQQAGGAGKGRVVGMGRDVHGVVASEIGEGYQGHARS